MVLEFNPGAYKMYDFYTRTHGKFDSHYCLTFDLFQRNGIEMYLCSFNGLKPSAAVSNCIEVEVIFVGLYSIE